MVVDEAGRAEVDYLARHVLDALDEDVLGLQVAMDQVQAVDVVQGVQHLLGDLEGSGKAQS